MHYVTVSKYLPKHSEIKTTKLVFTQFWRHFIKRVLNVSNFRLVVSD